ncbi:hypothetical protein AS156_18545 [Bradyrhizobium macuxiense]|uniref:Uncharacterized protein n=1 Tax=Bradyrhizobium macuxiense TaxID=1755647 RepID=A0A109JGM1_9BRAD|nr:hypothetical protein AS156_18545 [Bradyrhizobium macuxiense]
MLQDRVNLAKNASILIGQKRDAPKRARMDEFETDQSEPRRCHIEAKAGHSQTLARAFRWAKINGLPVKLSFFQENFVVEDRKVAMQQRHAETMVGALLHQTTPDFSQTGEIIGGEKAGIRCIDVRQGCVVVGMRLPQLDHVTSP